MPSASGLRGYKDDWHHCCWPLCPKPAHDAFHVPMCDFHGRLVHADVDATLIEPEATQYERLTRQTNLIRNRSHAARQATPVSERPGHIYYLRIGDVIKIGYASRLVARLRTYPPSMVLLAVHKGTLKDEAELHARFSPDRRAGREWYEQSERLQAHITAMRRQFGIPDTAVLLPRRMNTRRRTA